MHVPTRPRGHGLKFSITPLIDVVFLLIIFFLLATHVVQSEDLEQVDLPNASEVDTGIEEVPHRITVTITSTGAYQVAGQWRMQDEVIALISAAAAQHPEDVEVRLRLDESVAYSAYEPILLHCPQVGVTRIGFAVLEK